MSTGLRSLIASGTKLWLDSVDPQFVGPNRELGATGATSNPIIIAGIIRSGRFDEELTQFMQQDLGDEEIAWQLTDLVVRQARSLEATTSPD